MGKIVFAINLTLDGRFDHTAVIPDDELHDKAAELIRGAEVIVYGRVMYQLMEAYWPDAAADGSLSPSVRNFADAINAARKIVVSKSLRSVAWNSSVLRDVRREDFLEMKRRPGKDILLGGGAKTARAFMDLDLIDEYRLIVHPVVLGKGRRLFGDFHGRRDLHFVGQNIRRSGVVELIYRSGEPTNGG